MRRAPAKRAACAVSWALCAVCMALIFYFSSRTAVQSTAQSSEVLAWLETLFGQTLTSFIVRKAAHFTEFAGLGFLLANAFFQSRKKHAWLLAAAAASLYAVTDEVHQLFVPGRSCQISDWLLDSAGGLAGAALFLAVLAIGRRLDQKRRQPPGGPNGA